MGCIILYFEGLMQWIERHLFYCPSKKYFNIECPGCGLQRSIIALLRGNVIESVRLHPATIPLIIVVIYTMLHLKFNFKFGARNIKLLQILAASVIVVAYIYKVVNLKNFN